MRWSFKFQIVIDGTLNCSKEYTHTYSYQIVDYECIKIPPIFPAPDVKKYLPSLRGY